MELSQQSNYQISPSQLSTHKDCSQKWHFTYGLGVRPIGTETYFHVGSYWHELAHYYYQLIRSGFVVDSEPLKAAMIAKLKQDFSEANINYAHVYAKVHVMFMRYMEQRSPVIDTGIEILEVERELRYNLQEDLDLMGILDLAYREKGQVYLRDHKTGEYAASHSDTKMETQDQLLFYAAIWWKLYDEIPGIEVNWINSKVDHKKPPSHDQMFRRYRRIPSKQEISGFWTYLQDYVYHMQSVPPIRKFTTNCDNCRYKDPCIMSMRGINVDKILANSYVKIDRDYEFAKFTEISKQNTQTNITLKQSGITLSG